MRIAYVINSVEGGGAAAPVPAICRVMRSNGADPTVFALTRRDGRALPALAAAGLTTVVRAGSDRDHAAALSWLHAQLSACKPDVIWTSLTRATLLGQIVGRLNDVPVVSWQHAAYLKPANRFLLRRSRRHSALWVADSSAVLKLTAQRLRPAPESLVLWPLFAADATAPVARPWRSGEPLRLGSLGRLHPVKGYDVLVTALARLRADGWRRPFDVTVAGDGSERPALEARVREAGLDNVTFFGFTDRPQDFLASLHLYLQPSRSEGLCIAAHQAMQAGLPPLVSAVGEMPNTIDDGVTGVVVPPGDPAALATALAGLMSRPEALAGMGAAARDHVLAKFSRERFNACGAAILHRLQFMLGAPGAGRSPSPTIWETGRSASRRSG